MAEVSSLDKLTELEVEKEAILTTIEELKKSHDAGELNDDDYDESKREYEAKLKTIEGELADIQASFKSADASAIEEVGNTAAVEYSKMPWDELRTLAKERGVSLGKGITKDLVAEELKKLEKRAVEKTTTQVVAKEVAATKVTPSSVIGKGFEVEKPMRLEIDPTVKAQVEMIKGAIPSLNSTLAALKMKKQVGDSSLKVLKKNRDEGLIDEATFRNLKDKYESEVNSATEKINEISAETSSLERVISKFDELSVMQGEYKNILNKLEDTMQDKQRELDFMETGKLYIVSNLKNYLSGILAQLQALEEGEQARGVAYPDAGFIENKKLAIKKDKDDIADLKAKLDNFETLIASLEKEKEEGEIDQETYSVLKTEYLKEKNRTMEKMGKLKGHLKMMENEMKGYDKLGESIDACKSFIDMTNDSFAKIWLEEDIVKKHEEIDFKNQEIRQQESELSKRLEELESEVTVLLKRVST